MSSLDAQIREASDTNQQLLRILAQTDHAVPDLVEHQRYITDLEQQLHQTTQQLADVHKRRETDLKQHVKYRDSTFRRFAYKVGGKKEAFSDKAEKGEQEYFQTLQEAQRLGDAKGDLEKLLSEASRATGALQADADRHMQAQSDLDQLYHAIFQGPSPNYPEEDDKEQQANQALQVYHDTRLQVEGEAKATDLVVKAQYALRGSLAAMQNALSYSRMDMFGGGAMMDMMERSELATADRQLSATRLFVSRAQQASPFVQDLPPVTVAAGSLLSDVFFDNIFTDMAFHDKIKQSNAEMNNCAQALNAQVAASKERGETLSRALRDKEQTLEETRRALQDTRAAVFARIASGTAV